MDFTPEQKRRRTLALTIVVAACVPSLFRRCAPAGIAQAPAASLGALLQPLVGWIMDLSWQGAVSGGARVHAPADYRLETRCRNIWQEWSQ